MLFGGLSDCTVVSSLFIVNLPDPAEERCLQNRLIYAKETFWTAEIKEAIWHSASTICKEKCKGGGGGGEKRMCLKEAKNCY